MANSSESFFTPESSSSETQSTRRSARLSETRSRAEQEVGASPQLGGGSKRKKNSPVAGMSSSKKGKNTTSEPDRAEEGEPTNRQIIATINALGAKFDKKFETLASKRDLKKVEQELQGQIADHSRELREVKADVAEQKDNVRVIVREEIKNLSDKNVLGAAQAGAIVRQQHKTCKHARARRSIKIWPLQLVQGKEDELVRGFFINKMEVPVHVARLVKLDTIVPTAVTKRSKIRDEVLVVFADDEDRDCIKSYAAGLASSAGEAGLRLDIPPSLKGSLKILEQHGRGIQAMYGQQVKRSIKFDDRNDDLMMDIRLPGSTGWHNVTINQAREAMKVREEIDAENIRACGLGKRRNAPGQMAPEMARALMLDGANITPNSGESSTNSNSTSGEAGSFSQASTSRNQSDGLNDSIEEVVMGSQRGRQNNRQ